MIALGVSGGFGHEAAACLVVDGRVVAMVEEERLSRHKHAEGDGPGRSMRWCLRHAGIDAGEVDVLALSWDPARDPTAAHLAEAADRVRDDELWHGTRAKLVPVAHHAAHAASAFYPSGFDDAMVLVVDGNGEDVATTVWDADPTGLRLVHQQAGSQSLGHMYNAVTEFAGLGRHAAGKLMGLASYGTPLGPMPALLPDDAGYRVDIGGIDTGPSPQRFIDLRRTWRRLLADRFGAPLAPTAWPELPAGTVPGHYADVAATAQAALSRALADTVTAWLPRLGRRRLVLAGGVALNCSANGVLRGVDGVDDLFVIPPAHDAGGALGAALWVSVEAGVRPLCSPFSPFLGPEPDVAGAVDAARAAGLTVRHPVDPAAEGARLLAGGAVLGWVQGRGEVGPRALGARSLLALPHPGANRDRVNDHKQRERWRPLSPSLAARASARWVGGVSSPYMLLAVPAERGRGLDAAIHVDGSCRPQTVAPGLAPDAYVRLLDEVEALTGAPAVLNTSFNLAGEPMVAAGPDAVATFARSTWDALIVGDALIRRSDALD